MSGIEYFRFNPFLSTDVELNESDDKILLPMLIDVKRYIKKNISEFERLAKMLLGED